jgi:hypothetical protein
LEKKENHASANMQNQFLWLWTVVRC